MKLIPVDSSQIKAVGWADGKLRVQFHDRTKKGGGIVPGGIYEYDAPEHVHTALVGADTIGGHFHQHIRNGGYAFRRIEE